VSRLAEAWARGPLGRLRPSPFLLDVTFTVATTLLTLAALVLMTRWLAQGLGPERFGAYSLARRIASALTAFSPVGLALTRFLAMDSSPDRRAGYLLSGTASIVAPSLLLALVGLGLGAYWTDVVFRDLAYRSLWNATVLLVIGLNIYALLYAWYRGTGQMRVANLWQLAVVAFGPTLIAALYAGSARPDLVVDLQGWLLCAAALPVAVWVARALANAEVRRGFPERLAELLRYALPRVPGNVAFGGLLAVGPLLAPRFGGLREAGYLAAGQSVLRVIEGATAAFGLVALPRLAALHAAQHTSYVRARVADLVAMSLHVGLFLTLQLLVWCNEIVLLWLGPEYDSAVPLIRLTVLAVVPCLVFTLLRSVIDAVEDRAVNSVNLVRAFVVTLGLSLWLGALGGAVGLAIAGTVGFLVLGGLTLRHLRWAVTSAGLMPGRIGILNLLLALVMLGLRTVAVRHLSGPDLLLAAAATECATLAAYLLALRSLGVRWIKQVEERLHAPGEA
jgi:O-antigen/teichoic acid export membrane protein